MTSSNLSTTTVDVLSPQPGALVPMNFEGVRAVRVLSGGQFGARLATGTQPSVGTAWYRASDRRAIVLDHGTLWVDWRGANTGNAAEHSPLVLELYHGALPVFDSPAPDAAANVWFADPLNNFSVATGVLVTAAVIRAIDSTLFPGRGLSVASFTHIGGLLSCNGAFTAFQTVISGGLELLVGLSTSREDALNPGIHTVNIETGMYRPTGNGGIAAIDVAPLAPVAELARNETRLVFGLENRIRIQHFIGSNRLFSGRIFVYGQ